MIEPEAGVALPPVPHVIPERVHLRIGVQRADRVDPTSVQKTCEQRPRLRLHKRIVLIGFRGVDVRVRRHNIVIARQHDRCIEGVKLGGVLD